MKEQPWVKAKAFIDKKGLSLGQLKTFPFKLKARICDETEWFS